MSEEKFYDKHLFYSRPLKSEIQFEVDKSVQLVGLQYFSSASPSVIKAHFESFYFQVRKTASQEILGGGNSADRLVSNGINDDLFRVSPSCILDANTKYTIDLFFPLVPHNGVYLTYILESDKNVVTNDGDLTLRLHSNTISAYVTQLVFKE